jgi:hypothetical protein
VIDTTKTVRDDDEVQVEGRLFLMDDAAFLKTDHGFYEITDDEFYERARALVSPIQALDAVFIVQRQTTTDIDDGERPHQVRSCDYSVPMLTVHMGRSSFWATKDVCASLVAQDVGREFR